jgi:hypothetical protein
MMKRGTLIALGIFVVLLGVYFLTTESPPSEVSSPWTIPAVEEAARVELERPSDGEDGAKERVVFNKGDQGWRMVEPVSSTLRDSATTTLKNAFSSPIQTDDLRLDSERAGEYGVDQKKGVRLKVFSGGGETPTVDVLVGERTTVEGTGVERTYVRKPDASRIYRARTGLGTFVRKSVEEYRDKTIFDLDASAISSLRVERSDGPTIVLERSNGENGQNNKGNESWELTSPQVPWSLDTDEIESVIEAVATLSAKGFADDRTAGELGLDEPRATVTVSTGDGETAGTLAVGRVKSDEETTWYAKRTDRPYHYALSQYAGRKADVTLDDLRSKHPRPIEVASVQSVEFTGGDGLLVRRGDDGWTLEHPSTEASVDAGKIEGLVERVANLTVTGFPDITPPEAGLVGARDRIILETDASRVVLRLGDAADDGRYVGYQDEDEVFVVEGFVADKLTPSVDAVTTSGGSARGAAGPGAGREKRQKIEVLRGGKNKLKNLKQLKQQLGK